MSRFSRWPWKPPVVDEVDDELAFHLEMRTRELVEGGMSPEAARRAAEQRLGNVHRVRKTMRALGEGRDRRMRRTRYLGELLQDVAYTGRQLAKHRGFACLAIATLALGIGGTTTIFSVLNAVVLNPLPVREPSRLMLVGEVMHMDGMPQMPSAMSAGNYTDVVAAAKTFDGLAAMQFTNFNLADRGTPERVVAARVTANFFDVMGSQPLMGRVFAAAEDAPGREHVIVLANHLWKAKFGAARDIVNHTVRMNGEPYQVVGVMPSSFDRVTNGEDLWTPIAFSAERKAIHDEHYLVVYGRLKHGVSPQQAQADLDPIAARLRHDVPKDDSTLWLAVQPYVDQLVGDYPKRLYLLLGAVAAVLLIACANVANLLLARGAARGREIAVRTALGAGQWRIVRQLLTESVVLAMSAALAGLLLAHWGVAALVAWTPGQVPRLADARLDPVAFAFALATGIFSSVLCGLAPALRLSRTDVHADLRDGGRGATRGAARDRLRAALIVGEVALSVLLLFGAGLLIRSALALQRVNMGFDPSGVLSARLTLPSATYSDPKRVAETFRQISDAVAGIPGVAHAAVTSFAAMSAGGTSNGLIPEGRPFVLESVVQSQLRMVSSDFFQTMAVRIVKGRGFNDTDRAGGQKVMIVSETLAARAFPNQDPIGKRIACCEPGPKGESDPDWKIVVGVAADILSRGPAAPPSPEFYLPVPQVPAAAWTWTGQTMFIVARTAVDPMSLVQPLRSRMARIDADVPLFDVRPMNQRLAASLAESRFNTLMLTTLGIVGLMLAASGIYGVIAYFVSQRTQEIGVRMALGATSGAVVRLVLRQAMTPVAIGTAAGVAAALATSGALSAQLFGVTRSDPVTAVAVVVVLLGVAAVASIMPARRAASIDPTRALQGD